MRRVAGRPSQRHLLGSLAQLVSMSGRQCGAEQNSTTIRLPRFWSCSATACCVTSLFLSFLTGKKGFTVPTSQHLTLVRSSPASHCFLALFSVPTHWVVPRTNM